MEMKWISSLGMVLRKEGPARSVGFWRLPGRATVILRDSTLTKRGCLGDSVSCFPDLCANLCTGSESNTREAGGVLLLLEVSPACSRRTNLAYPGQKKRRTSSAPTRVTNSKGHLRSLLTGDSGDWQKIV